MAKEEQYVDLSHRILAVAGWNLGIVFVSFSSAYCILSAAHMMTMRGTHKPYASRSLPPTHKEVTSPHQRWRWDISYMAIYEKGLFRYLYLLLDEYSGKAISWLVSWSQIARGARYLFEEALINENILDLPEDRHPEMINDRGLQMKAKSIKRMFDNHSTSYFQDHELPMTIPLWDHTLVW